MVGERRALASAVMAFYFMLFLVFALSGLVPEMERALYALAGVYGLAFFSLVAGYFWARWYTVGVGLFGLITTVVGLWQTDPELRPLILNQMLFFGGTHLATSLMLWGDAMSKSYDGQSAWRERYHMDDGAVQRLGRAVIRAGVSLPFVMLYAFGPRPDDSIAIAIAAVGLTALGVRALIKMRTWGVLALGGAGVLLVSTATADVAGGSGLASAALPALAGGFLLSAAAPFGRTMARFVFARA